MIKKIYLTRFTMGNHGVTQVCLFTHKKYFYCDPNLYILSIIKQKLHSRYAFHRLLLIKYHDKLLLLISNYQS